MKKLMLSYSCISCFLSCRIKYKYRYIDYLFPNEKSESLRVGSAIHAGLEQWFRSSNAPFAIDTACDDAAASGLSMECQIKVRAMMERYIEIYKDESFEVVDIEQKFSSKVKSSKSRRAYSGAELIGRVDGAVRKPDGLYILEHKTTAALSSGYIERIPLDTQIALYAVAMEKMYNEPIVGAIYDILVKPLISMRQGETQEEFEARRAELIAKSKSGKSTAQRKEAETEDEFLQRCKENLVDDKFLRFTVKFSHERLAEASEDFVSIAKEMRRPAIYPTTSSCDRCEYRALCLAGGDPEKCSGFSRRDPHKIQEIQGDQECE